MKKAFVFGLVLGTMMWVFNPTIINFLESAMDAIDERRIMAARNAHSIEEYKEALRQLNEISVEDLFYWNNTISG